MKEIAGLLGSVLILIIVFFGLFTFIWVVFNSFWPVLLEGIKEIGEAWRG